MKTFWDKILQFIEKHKSFIKKIIIFFIAYVAIALCNNPAIVSLLNSIFGEVITTGVQACAAPVLLTLGGD